MFTNKITERKYKVYLRNHSDNPIRSYYEYLAQAGLLPEGGNINQAGVEAIDQAGANKIYTLTEDVDVSGKTLNIAVGSVIGKHTPYSLTADAGTIPDGAEGYLYYGTSSDAEQVTHTTPFSEVGVCDNDLKIVGSEGATRKILSGKKLVLTEKLDISFSDLTIFEGTNYADFRNLGKVDILFVDDESEFTIYLGGIKANALPDITSGDVSSVKLSTAKEVVNIDKTLYIGV